MATTYLHDFTFHSEVEESDFYRAERLPASQFASGRNLRTFGSTMSSSATATTSFHELGKNRCRKMS